MVMNNKDVSPDKQLLHKIAGRLVAMSVRAKSQKNARLGKEAMEGKGPSLPFLYQG
jgi:hypothetical protein